jgi:hypothetical protein
MAFRFVEVFMRLPLALVVFAACDAENNPLADAPEDGALMVFGPTMTLTTTPWVSTFAAVVTVTGAPANGKLQLLSSPNTVGAGVCSPKTAPMCFDVAAPLVSLGSKKADAAGKATFTITVPNPVVSPTIELQAVFINGATSQKSTTVVVLEHDLGSDRDADGLVAEDELSIWLTDPSNDDTDGDLFFDGTEATGGTDPLDGADFPPTYDDDMYPGLFLVECTPCHVNGGINGGLNLDKYKNIVNRPSDDVPTMDRIEPFDMQNSYMWHKLSGTQLLVGGSGLQMPRNGPPFLTVDQMALVETWINTGALEGPDK